jgi:hypothetical protein
LPDGSLILSSRIAEEFLNGSTSAHELDTEVEDRACTKCINNSDQTEARKFSILLELEEDSRDLVAILANILALEVGQLALLELIFEVWLHV